MPNLPASSVLWRPDLSRFAPADPLLWAGFAAVALGTAAVCRLQGISIEGGSVQYIGAFIIVVAGCLTRGFIPRLVSIAILLETMAAFIVFPAVFAPLSYAITRSPFPPIDTALRAADLLAGFDAVKWHDLIAANPILRWINGVAYDSLLPQSLLAILILPRVGNGLRGFTMARVSSVALFIAAIVAYLLPAAGTIPSSEGWYADWTALRHLDIPFQTTADHVEGIVSFPSFHAAMAVILAYSLRGMGVFSWLAVAVNLLMIIATPAGGYHYLTDVIAGLVVAAGAIALVQYADEHGAGPGQRP